MIIQDPGPTRKLQQGLRLTELPDAVLAPEIVGVILLEDFSAPLSDIARGCYGTGGAGPVAAELPILALTPTTDGVAVVINEALISTTTTQDILVTVPTVAVPGLTTLTSSRFAESDIPGRPSALVGTDQAIGAPTGTTIMRFAVLANTPYLLKLEYRFGPGSFGMVITGGTVNTLLRVNWKWTESAPLG